MSNQFNTSRKLAELKKAYFSDESRSILVRKGETLLTENTINNRLYLVTQGSLACYLRDDDGKEYKVMETVRNMFLGVYSFFSVEQKSYLTVIASENTQLSYIERTDALVGSEKFARDFLIVLVNEIYQRQVLTQQFNKERQAAIKKLYESEKMIVLGQLAAGLAHELNNAIGILRRNTEWLISEMTELMRKRALSELFLSALEGGQQQSTIEIRERKQYLETHLELTSKLAKKLAKTTLPLTALEKLVGKGVNDLSSLHQTTEAAIVLHDMRVAANHATHVVMSVRDLGNNQNVIPLETSLEETMGKALTLAKNLTKQLTVILDIQTKGCLLANPGDLVQVWLNLIKNACESMLQSKTPKPVLSISIVEEEKNYTVKIVDNGEGISADLMNRIFEPNFTTKVQGLSFGLGLGLSIVKKIIDSCKGSIVVTSQPGETCFIVKLPKP